MVDDAIFDAFARFRGRLTATERLSRDDTHARGANAGSEDQVAS